MIFASGFARLLCSILRIISKISCSNPATLTPKTLHAFNNIDLVHLEVSIIDGVPNSREFGWSIPYQGRGSVSEEERSASELLTTPKGLIEGDLGII